MKNYPKISIVTPNYNMGDFLEQTILSIVSQSYPNLEYIVIDGGSNDHSLDIIKKYEEHISYWISESDNGMYDAIQKGFQKSSGEIMGWLNSDDLLLPNSLFTIAELFNTFPDAKWLNGLPVSTNKKGQFFDTGRLRKWSKYYFYIGQFQWIQQESTYWRRDLWEKAGGSMQTNMKYAGDFELWLRFFRHGQLFTTSALIGSFRFRGEEQISNGLLPQYMAEANAALKEEKKKLTSKEKIYTIFCSVLFFIFRIFRKLGIHSFERFIIYPLFKTPNYLLFDKKRQIYFKSKTIKK